MVGGWLFVVGCGVGRDLRFVVGCWLLVVAGLLLLVDACWCFLVGCWWLVVCVLLLVDGF